MAHAPPLAAAKYIPPTAVAPVARGPSTTLLTGFRSVPHPGSMPSSAAVTSVGTPQYASGTWNLHPYSTEGRRLLHDSEAVGRALTSINESAWDFVLEAPTSVQGILNQAASWAGHAAQIRPVRANSAVMSSLIKQLISSQGNILSTAQLTDEVTVRFGLSSAGRAGSSVMEPLGRSDTNAIHSGSNPVTVAEPVEVVDDPVGATAPSSSESLPLPRLRSGRR